MLACAVRLLCVITLVSWAACASLLVGCGYVDTGPAVGPPATCNAPPAFFVTDVWPKFFVKYGCGMSNCHDATTGHGYFRLQDVSGVTPPDPTSPTSLWPMAWQQNYTEVTANLSCASPETSAVLAIPAGQGEPHPGGNVVTDIPGADSLFDTWLK
jgi:hypothetical protein